MNCDWNDITIGDIGYIVTGKTPSTKVKSNFGGDIHFITPKDLQVNKHVFVTERTLTKEGLKSVKGSIIPPDSICVSCIGNLGYVAKATMDCTTNQQINSIIPYSKYDHDFVFYLMKSLYPIFKSYEKQSTTLSILNKSSFAKIKVKVPDFKKQRKIAGVLSALDDKIELNNKINRNLEAQAQAIFKSWFIDFEPFKNGKFIDSELGRIPEGWKVESIYSISEVIYGAPFSSNLFNNKQLGTPIIRIRDLPNEASNTYTTESHPKGYLIKQGDIVVGMDGEFKAYLWGGDNAWLNQRICVFKSKLNVSTAFVMFSIVPLLNEVESSELATTVIHLGKNDIDRFKIILPKLDILKEFNKISIPIFDTIIKNKKESQRLTQLRDTLLPKLMSGEIDVSDIAV